jgi:outer membrane protein, multidrug efflux system
MTSTTSPARTNLRMIAGRCLLGLAMLAFSACSVGPKYRRPDVAVPSVYRGVDPAAGPQTANSLGDEKWWTVFHDPQLQDLIRTALAQNYDVRIAATRVLEAEASLGITRANQFPTVAAEASATSERVAKTAISQEFETSPTQLDLAFAWELDFWGKFRNATKAARATLLATEWGQKAVLSTIVSDVAQAYFQLLELDAELEISNTTLAARKDSLRLVNIRERGGTTSMMDVYQSEQLVYGAAAALPDLERRIQQQENFISILIGKNPGPIQRGAPLAAFTIAPTVPAGLPSALLIRRPDIESAEQTLIAANAQIGVARAAYFPQITLTASGGFQSNALSQLFTGPAGMWSFGGQLLQPIFTGGRIRSTVRLTEAQKQEAVLVYQQTIQQAFRDVSDSLVAYQKNQDFRQQQQLLTNSAQNGSQLSNVRYAGGVTSYLEVLDADTRYYEAQINLAQAQLNERLALVQVYKSLGGGWQQ